MLLKAIAAIEDQAFVMHACVECMDGEGGGVCWVFCAGIGTLQHACRRNALNAYRLLIC